MKPWQIALGAAVGAVVLFARGSSARAQARGPRTSAGMSTIRVDENDPQLTRWAPIVIPLAVAAKIPPAFVMAWAGIESAGNAAAVGSRTATGPDGAPREIGLFQMLNPSDFAPLGVSPLELVAYCVRPGAGPKLHPTGDTDAHGVFHPDGGYADGSLYNQQLLARPMTPAEQLRHVKVGIDFIRGKRAYADRYLMASGITWPTNGPDYWSAVKLAHALPSIVNPGFAQVTHALGHPPTSWREFRSTYEKLYPAAAFDPTKAERGLEQNILYRCLENAEWTGARVQGAAVT
jgi:hypothetical protein